MKFKSGLFLFICLFSLSPFLSFADEESCQIDSPLPPAPPWAKIYVSGYRYAEGDQSLIQFYGRTQAFRPKNSYVVASVEGEEPVFYRTQVTRRHRFETEFIRIREKNTRIEIYFQDWEEGWFTTVGFANTEKNGFCGFDKTMRVE